MEFHEELKAARIKTGLTQQQIADKLGITKSTYCGYETAKRSPDPQRIKQLAKVLHVSADALLDISIEKETSLAPAKAETKEVSADQIRALFVAAGIMPDGADQRFFGKPDELTALMFGKRKRVDVVIE